MSFIVSKLKLLEWESKWPDTFHLGPTRRRSSIVSYAGVDPAVDESGKHISRSNPTTKRGSSHLRKTLYQIVCAYLKHSPTDEPVYQFLDKKRTEGKPYFVYMTAAENKFLRIYYARVKECLVAADAQEFNED